MGVHAERAGWSSAEIARVRAQHDCLVPRIDFVAEAEQCAVCAGTLRVRKTSTRTVVTLAEGTFKVREILKQCVSNTTCPVARSQALQRVVKRRQSFGYDLMVHVGQSRYLAGRQREEIRADLRVQKGIELSGGTISYLCDRFLLYMEALHLLRAPSLRAAMKHGYPLHLDATCEYGKGGLFICMDGWQDWVLLAVRIPSEREEYLKPPVEKTVALFGDPVSTMRDLGKAGAGAIASLRKRGIPDLVCHYHFLGAVGTKLLDGPYELLRNLIRSCSLHSDMREFLRELRRYGAVQNHDGRFGLGTVRENLPALIWWVLEGEGRKELPYPFALPHRDFARRCQAALQRAETWVPCPHTIPERRSLRHLASLIGSFARNTRASVALQQLAEGWQVFSELRDVLRLTESELPRGDVRLRQSTIPALEALRLKEIEASVQVYQEELQTRTQGMTKMDKKSSPYAIVQKYLQRYGSHLFGHPVRRDADGGVSAMADRTNNVSEHFFGGTKQELRRRVGRANLGHDLEQQPAQAALVRNLRHPEYVRILCGSLDQLPAAFADLDINGKMPREATLVRDNRNTTLRRRVRELVVHDETSSGSEAAQVP